MSLNQYAVYQLKTDASTRPIRYKSYQELLGNHIQVISTNYRQVYQTVMLQDTSPEEIRGQLEKKLPSKSRGAALNVSDVIAITNDGITTAYYVDTKGLVVIPGFFRMNTSTTMITMETTGFVFDNRKGSWMATDEKIIDGKQFFLMESETYGFRAAYAVVDSQGKQAADDTYNGFDDKTIQQIRDYLMKTPPVPEASRTPEGKPPLETYQKYFENGEYLRSAESGTEQNYNMIDGISNNKGKKEPEKDRKEPPAKEEHSAKKKGKEKPDDPKKRPSLLKRLDDKKKLVAARYGEKAPEQEKDDMERNRK